MTSKSNDRENGLYALAAHIRVVQARMGLVISRLTTRLVAHDATKYHVQEVDLLDSKTKLDKIKYMSDEYKDALAEIDSAVQHHYRHNSHHPEHYEHGIKDMSLLDLIEMLCDWEAASKLTVGGSFAQSMEKNVERFGISKEMEGILHKTAVELGMIEG